MRPRKIRLLELIRVGSVCNLYNIMGYLELKKKYDMLNGLICHRCGQIDNCPHYPKKEHSKNNLKVSIGEIVNG